jgi:hypothetical protein
MKRLQVNILSHKERAEPNRQLKDVVEVDLLVLVKGNSARQLFFVRKVYCSVRLCIDYHSLVENTCNDAYPLLPMEIFLPRTVRREVLHSS